MSNSCSVASLKNLGLRTCKYTFEEIKRLMFVLPKKESGALNCVSATNAALLSAWQTLFNKQQYDSDVMEKVVCTPVIYDCKSEQGDPEVYENAGYHDKLRDGNYDVAFLLEGIHPNLVKQFKTYENLTVGVYLADQESRALGKVSGTDVYPLLCEVDVRNWQVPDREKPPQTIVRLRFITPSDFNLVDYFQILDGDGAVANINDETQFYSLIDGSQTITEPAVTGCVTTIIDDRYREPVRGHVYTDFVFVKVSDSSEVSLASADSLTEASGAYTIDEEALLEAGETYNLKDSADKYDITYGSVVVPE